MQVCHHTVRSLSQLPSSDHRAWQKLATTGTEALVQHDHSSISNLSIIVSSSSSSSHKLSVIRGWTQPVVHVLPTSPCSSQTAHWVLWATALRRSKMLRHYSAMVTKNASAYRWHCGGGEVRSSCPPKFWAGIILHGSLSLFDTHGLVTLRPSDL